MLRPQRGEQSAAWVGRARARIERRLARVQRQLKVLREMRSPCVAIMKRDLGRRGRPKGSLAVPSDGPPAPGIGVPTPRLLPGNEPEGWPREDAEPRG